MSRKETGTYRHISIKICWNFICSTLKLIKWRFNFYHVPWIFLHTHIWYVCCCYCMCIIWFIMVTTMTILKAFFPDWITVLAMQPNAAYSICSERFGSANFQKSTVRTHYFSAHQPFTGCASQNVSPSNWQLWRIDPSTAPLRPTYSHVSPAVPTWHPDDGCSLLPHMVWKFRPFVSLHFASGCFWFLLPPSETNCLSTSHLRCHSQFSDNDSRPFCFPFLPRHFDTCGPCNN